jgi:hypothetical protein
VPEKVYIDGKPVTHPTEAIIRMAVGLGRMVVVVDEAGVPVQITPELLFPKCASQPSSS